MDGDDDDVGIGYVCVFKSMTYFFTRKLAEVSRKRDDEQEKKYFFLNFSSTSSSHSLRVRPSQLLALQVKKLLFFLPALSHTQIHILFEIDTRAAGARAAQTCRVVMIIINIFLSILSSPLFSCSAHITQSSSSSST